MGKGNNRYNYYVAVKKDDGTLKYITKIDKASKSWFAEDGEDAMVFDQLIAKSYVEALCMALTPAVMVMAPNFIELHN